MEAFNKLKSKKYNVLIAIIAIITLGFMAYAYVLKEEERIINRDMKILVQTDGKVYVEDIWDINVVDSSTLFITFDRATKSNFSDIKVSYLKENSSTWAPMIQNNSISLDGKEPLNFFHAETYAGQFEIAWGVGLEGSRARRQYKIEYIVDGPTIKYADTAQYYHMLVGKKFKIPIENFSALITFPAPLREETSQIWGHGAPSGTIFFKDGKVEIKAKKVPINTFIEGRVIFPREIVYMAPDNSHFMKDSIIAEEERNAANTMVAVINETNREDFMKKSIAAIIVYLGIVIAYESFRTIKIKTDFPRGHVREWERYADLPKPKLDIAAANVIYEDKGAKDFLISVLMKLAHNKYLEIIKVQEKFDSNDSLVLDSLDEGMKERIKFLIEVSNEKGLDVSPTQLANVYSSVEKSLRTQKALELHIKEKDLSNIRYKLNLRKIEEAAAEDKLGRDEMLVISFLKDTARNVIITEFEYNKRVKSISKIARVNIPTEVFIEANKRFNEEVTNAIGTLYIEQYQLIYTLVKQFTSFSAKYDQLIKETKLEQEEAKIYSVEKERKAVSLLLKPFLEIGVLIVGIYLVFKNLVGPVQFNEPQYILGTGAILVSSVIILLVNKIQFKALDPHLTTAGLNIEAEYRGLYNFLNNDSFIKEYPEESVVIWGEFLVLATYFGIAKKVLRTLQKIHPQIVTELQNTNYTFLDSYHLLRIMDVITTSHRNAALITTGRLISTGASALSRGGGGGFTSGGGGGFGGGGGGSR